MIKKTKAGYQVKSKSGDKKMGEYPTKTAAIKRLMQVEVMKKKKK